MKSDVQNRKDNMQDETTPKFDFVFGFLLSSFVSFSAIGIL